VVTTRYTAGLHYPTGVVRTVDHQLMAGTVELLVKQIVEVLAGCLLEEDEHQSIWAVLILHRRMVEELRGCP